MRGIFRIIAAGAAMLVLSACNMFPVGPDLAKAPTPFGDAAQVRLLNDSQGVKAEIRHTVDGDRVTLNYPLLGQKSYDGYVTYSAYDGGWLMAANLFQTPDRSVYALLKFPKGASFAPGSETEGEIMMLTCAMRMPSEAEIKAKYENVDENATEEEQAEIMANALMDIMGACDFTTVAEVQAFVPKVLAAEKAEDEANATLPDEEKKDSYKWEAITIQVP